MERTDVLALNSDGERVSAPTALYHPSSPDGSATNTAARCAPTRSISTSEIPLVAGLSPSPSVLSSPKSSPYNNYNNTAATDDPSGDHTAPAAIPGPVRRARFSRSPPHAPCVPPATAAATATDESKVVLAVLGCNIALLVPVVLYVKDLTVSWEAGWRVLYGILLVLALVWTVAGFFTVWWATRFASVCARIGLIVAAAVFVVYAACKLGRLGCAAGAASAAVVVLLLILIWIWTDQPTTDQAEATADQDASLPDDAP